MSPPIKKPCCVCSRPTKTNGRKLRRSCSRAMVSELPHDLQAGLREMVESLHALKLRFTLIGGIAVGYRRRTRFTRSLDFLLEVPQLVLPPLLQDLQARGFSFDTDKTIREWTSDHLT